VAVALFRLAIWGTVFLLAGCERESSPPNIVFVCLDTVREDFTGVGDDRVDLTPELDRLAAEGTIFRNAWATSPWTVPSHASFFTGLLSSAHGCHHRNLRLPAAVPTLAEILGTGGYQTAAFYSNPWLTDSATGLLRGFAYQGEAPMIGGLEGDPGRYPGDQGGRASNLSVSRWLDTLTGEAPFFLFVNFLEAHLPYHPPPDIRRRLLADIPAPEEVSIRWAMEFNAGLHPPATVDWNRVRRLYGGDVRSVDRLLANLIATLERHGRLEDTVLIIVSDHGENLGDHGLVEHQFSVHETLLAVPLIIRAPDRLPQGVRDDPVMLSDLFATIVDLARIDEVTVPETSRSLLGPVADPQRPVIAEYMSPNQAMLDEILRKNPERDITSLARGLVTIRRGDLRLTVADDGAVALHDLAADPAQEHNLASVRGEDVASLLRLLEDSLPEQRPTAGPVELDDKTRNQLRSLGYIR